MHAILMLLALSARHDDNIVQAIKRASISIPFEKREDRDAMQKLLQGSTVIGVGECTHGSHEVFEAKSGFFRFLVEKLGFTVLELEASMQACTAMDDYVLNGTGDPAAAVKGQGFWTWSTQEILDLVLWMRSYNLDPAHKQKLRVIGVDMQDREGAIKYVASSLKAIGAKDPLIDDVNRFSNVRYAKGREAAIEDFENAVTRNLPEYTKRFGTEKATLLGGVVHSLRQADDLQQREVLLDDFIGAREDAVAVLQDVVDATPGLMADCKDMTGDGKYAMDLLSELSNLRAKATYDVPRLENGIKVLKTFGAGRKGLEGKYKQAATVLEFLAQTPGYIHATQHSPRDIDMAENAEWVVNTLFPGQKAMLWAHNFHVCCSSSDQPETCGRELTRRLGDKYFPIGFTFGSGDFRAFAARSNDLAPKTFTVTPEAGGSLDLALGKSDKKAYFLNCSAEGVKEWLTTDLTTRNFGSQFDETTPSIYLLKAKPASLYRGLVFIQKVTASLPLPN